ncbi:MAG TPA: PEGA domain-containing protein [Candidatus Deferrimicrobium sp.]|nr:PEGA domain-containing protein [Candidatus Deferrimicrobium sp.]
MKKIGYVCIVILIYVLTGCTFPYPYENWEAGYSDYRVVLLVNPDDADVLLDGKFIGTAYEFASKDAPLRLHSRNHELVIKKEGYNEELINLSAYSTPDITIRLNLSEDRYYSQSQVKKRTGEEVKAKTTAPGYKPVPQTEPEKEPPVEMGAEEAEDEGSNVELINVTLEIEPKEAAIYLDGKFWGIAPESGTIDNLRLEPGKYTLEIVKPGYQSIKKELDIKDRDLTLTFKLEK